MKKIILFGDSLFAYLTKAPIKHLEETVGDIDVYNCATGGWDSNDVLKKALYIQSLKPDVIALSLGTNDASPWKRVEVKDYEQNLKAIFEKFKNSKIIMFPPPPINESKHPIERMRTNEEVKKYYDAAVRVAADMECAFIDSWGLFMPLQSTGRDYHIRPLPLPNLQIVNPSNKVKA